MVAPTPHSSESTCPKCKKTTTVHIVEGLHGPTHDPQVCPHCGGLLPAPSGPAMDAYVRDQHPFKRH